MHICPPTRELLVLLIITTINNQKLEQCFSNIVCVCVHVSLCVKHVSMYI